MTSLCVSTTATHSSPAKAPRKSWVAIALLMLLAAVSVIVRLDHITRKNLWFDEYVTLYLATGRGELLFELPQNQILSQAPVVDFTNAPAWWHIWNGIRATSHPPLYHITLHFWAELFGSGDGSVRFLSTVFSCGCVILLYIAARKLGADRTQALLAAAIMAIAPVQILYGQQARPYTMLQFFELAAAIAVISIEKRGWTWLGLVALGIAVLILGLTHYFSAAFIFACVAYCLLRLRGRNRTAAIAAILLASVIAAVAWGSRVSEYNLQSYGRLPDRNLLHLFLSVPQRLTMETDHDPLEMVDHGSWLLVIPIALLAYLVPLLVLRTRPYVLFWWLWMASSIGMILCLDIARHSTLLSFTRYVMLAAPAVYALLVVPLPGRIGRLTPWLVPLGLIAYTAAYLQAGPPDSRSMSAVSKLIREEVRPGDVLIITGNYYYYGKFDPPLSFWILDHYGHPWQTPIVFGTAQLSPAVQKQLCAYHRIWIVGVSPQGDTEKILPGWRVLESHGIGPSDAVWRVTPDGMEKS